MLYFQLGYGLTYWEIITTPSSCILGKDPTFRSKRVRFEEQKLASYGIQLDPVPTVKNIKSY